MTKEDLKDIYIRAYTDKWESVSLQDLIDRGYGNEIRKWFMSKLARLDEQEIITEDIAVLMVSYLESAGIPIVRLNRPDETREDKWRSQGYVEGGK